MSRSTKIGSFVFLFAMLIAAMATISNGKPSAAAVDPALVGADIAWMLTASALVLLMTPGLAFFYGGMVRKKNVISTMLQSAASMGVISILWLVVGFSLAFGDSIGGIIGNPFTYLFFNGVGAAPNAAFAATIPLALFALFQLKFAIITPALITGSFAERIKFSSYVIFMVLFSLLIYAPVAHWTWHPNGFLRQWGVLDFAGGAVVHMTSGFAALAGALAIGRRIHVADGGHQPANIPFVVLGTGLLWFGWFGFNAGSALSAGGPAVTAFLTTNMASAAAMIGWLLLEIANGRKPTAQGGCTGAVVGLVAVTPAAGFINVGSSVLIGLVASAISYMAVQWKNQSKVDDALDVFPCHGVGGAVGMIATAIFAGEGGLIYGSPRLLLVHLAALAIVAGYSFGVSFFLFKLVDKLLLLRVATHEESHGLDLTQHGETLEPAS